MPAIVRQLGRVSLPGVFDTPWRLVAAGFYQPARLDGGAPWSRPDLQTIRAAGAATIALLEDSKAAPVPVADHDAWRATVFAARRCVVQRQPDRWPHATDLTAPLCWGAEWLHWWITGHAALDEGARVSLIDAAVLIIYSCNEALDGAVRASDDRRVDRWLAHLDRLLGRLQRPGLAIAAAAAAATWAGDAT